jgi:hypothetical protein
MDLPLLTFDGYHNIRVLTTYLSLNFYNSPTSVGSATAAGPGPENSAAIGPRLLVGVHWLCFIPPILN